MRIARNWRETLDFTFVLTVYSYTKYVKLIRTEYMKEEKVEGRKLQQVRKICRFATFVAIFDGNQISSNWMLLL